MFRCLFGLFFLLVSSSTVRAQTVPSPADIQSMLSRSEDLYFEAQFKESIQLLTPLDRALAEQAALIQDRVKVKLQLALAHIGLNETDAAKTRLSELCRLDPEYELDPQQFAPKILTLFSEVRADQTKAQTKARCSTVCDEANKLLMDVNHHALLALLQSAASTSCPCLEDAALEAADLALKRGIEEYKNNEIVSSLKSLRMALSLKPGQEVATQYIDLAQTKLQLTIDRLVLDWRKHFEAGEFPKASTVYRELLSPALEEKSGPALDQVRAEYRKQASAIADTWKRNCSTIPPSLLAKTEVRIIDGVSFDEYRKKVNTMLPDPSIAGDIVAQITPCAPPPRAPAAPPREVQDQPCLQLQTQDAMARLKTRVDPQVTGAARPTSPVNFLLNINLDKHGNVTVNRVQGPSLALNGLVQAAVERWKFSPAIVENEPRCVDTVLPITLNP
jgi:hypothetical protein